MTDQIESGAKRMKPIWYFVGWLLLVVGVIVLGTGLYGLVSPPERTTVLSELHTDIWWGAVIVAGGLVFLWSNRKATVE